MVIYKKHKALSLITKDNHPIGLISDRCHAIGIWKKEKKKKTIKNKTFKNYQYGENQKTLKQGGTPPQMLTRRIRLDG